MARSEKVSGGRLVLRWGAEDDGDAAGGDGDVAVDEFESIGFGAEDDGSGFEDSGGAGVHLIEVEEHEAVGGWSFADGFDGDGAAEG